jgi:hypothetical protein
MRPSTTALAIGSAAALALSGVSAAEPRAGAPRAGQPPAGASTAETSPAAEPHAPAQAEPKAPSAPPEPGEAAPAPSPYEGQASPEGAPEQEPTPRPQPRAVLHPQLVQRPPPSVDSPDEPAAPARDTVGGHFAIGVDAGLLVPFGSIASGVPQSRTMGLGLSIGGDLAYGISRTVMLGAYVDFGLPDAKGASSNHSITTIAAGPLIRYHLVQGMAFDPWLSGGVGFRLTSDGPTSFTGIDWMRLALGGDWYPASNLGFGPILELSLGSFFAQSPGTLGNASVNATFVLGGRIVFDAPGK